MEEKADITAAQNGDVRAFNRLLDGYQTLAYNIAYRILGDVDEAADACQEAFLSAFKNIRRFRGGVFKSWLMRIVTNACYDRLRYRRRRRTESLEDLAQNPDDDSYLCDPVPQPENHLLSRELEQTIMKGLQSLPEDQRTTLVLVDIHGFSYQEVAEITSAATGTVRSRLSRARAKLRDYLVACGELLPARYRPKDEDMAVDTRPVKSR